MIKNLFSRPVASVLALSLCSGLAVHAATPILEYDFNDSGTSTSSSGSTSYELEMYDSGGTSSAADLHGNSGSGVSGLAGDYAFDNTDATGMGTNGVGGAARGTGILSDLSGLQSLTITGWFNAASLITDYPNILGNIEDGEKGFLLTGNNGRLSLQVNTSAYVSGGGVYNTTNEWVFFAVSYDGTVSSDNLTYYVGDMNTSVTVETLRSLDQGAIAGSANPFTIGNVATGSTIRPFDGLLDDIAIYGSKLDASGVLSLSEIEQIRLSSIPEPSATSGLIGCGVLVMVLCARREASRE